MAGRSVEEWERLALQVVLDMLGEHHAVTVSEMEARASDRTWNPSIVPTPINPHHLTTARSVLQTVGRIAVSSDTTRGGHVVNTWSLADRAGKRATVDAAARKRLLTARHDGWNRRGGAGRGLIGAAGEDAMLVALRGAGVYAGIQHSATSALGVDLTDLGELDFVAGLYDTSVMDDPAAITVVVEVKNTRQWYYDDDVAQSDGPVRRFLRKTARVQAERPRALICPVFIGRRCQQTLVYRGDADGFLVASTEVQLVLADHDMDRVAGSFEEVRDELGYADLRRHALGRTTNFHRGIAAKHIPKHARTAALRWREVHSDYL